MRIVTVSGKAQNGKDTFAVFAKEYFEEKGEKTLVFHYADYLKFICEKYFGWNGVKDENGRGLLQFVGTDVFRKNNPDCWVNVAKEFVKGLGDEYERIIIPDTRFPNEIETWTNDMEIHGVFAVRVVRPGFDNGLTEEQKNHPSETALNGYDLTEITNDGTLEDFKKKVRDFIDEYEYLI